MSWEDALYEARRYHTKKMRHRYELGIEYDEDSAEYDAMPKIVQDALNYLCEIGEIN